MWIRKKRAWLLIMGAVVGFGYLNMNGLATEIRIPGAVYSNVPLPIALFAAFALGLLLAFLLTLVNYLKGLATMGRLSRESQCKKQELRSLRSLRVEVLRIGDREA